MIDITSALLLFSGGTVLSGTLLALTLAALMLMDFTLDAQSPPEETR